MGVYYSATPAITVVGTPFLTIFFLEFYNKLVLSCFVVLVMAAMQPPQEEFVEVVVVGAVGVVNCIAKAWRKDRLEITLITLASSGGG